MSGSWPRRFACASALGTSVIAGFAACSFPNVAFYDASADGTATNDGPGAEADDDAQPGGEAGPDSTTDANSLDSPSDGIHDATPGRDGADASAPDTGSGRDTGSTMDSGGTVNCDCGADAMMPTNFSCGLLSLPCTGGGFMGNVACGESGNWVTCMPATVLGLGCSASQPGPMIQQCR